MLMLASHEGTELADPYSSRFFRTYRKLLTAVLRMRIPVILVFVVLLVGSGMSFRFVNQMFFPNSSRPQFMVDVWLPEGTRIERTSEVLRNLENLLGKKPEIQSIAAFIGQGPPRFYLPVEPEKPYSSYGQLIVSLKDFRDAEKLMHEIDVWANENLADAEVIPRKYGLGPSETWAVRLRISGPAVADPIRCADWQTRQKRSSRPAHRPRLCALIGGNGCRPLSPSTTSPTVAGRTWIAKTLQMQRGAPSME